MLAGMVRVLATKLLPPSTRRVVKEGDGVRWGRTIACGDEDKHQRLAFQCTFHRQSLPAVICLSRLNTSVSGGRFFFLLFFFSARLIDTKVCRVMQTSEAEGRRFKWLILSLPPSRLVFLKVTRKLQHLQDIFKAMSVLTKESARTLAFPPPSDPSCTSFPPPCLQVADPASEGYFTEGSSRGCGLGGASIYLQHGVNFSRLG